MDHDRIRRYAADPAAFRADLIIPGAHGPARFGDVMADFQRRDFAALDKAFLALRDGRKPELGRYWLERTKGASKDSDLAVELLWLLAFCPRPLTAQVGAADADQADELRKAAKGILRLNPLLADVIEIQSLTILNPRTESRCEIIPADVAGSHGARPDLLILNELSHVGKREFAENLLDNASKVPHGVVVIATNAGHLGTWQYTWRENARTSDRWYFSAVTEPASWLDPAEIEEARRRNPPNRFARLWRGQWLPETGDALDPEALRVAFAGDLQPLDRPEDELTYGAGLDLGLKRHRAAFVIVARHPETGNYRLVRVFSWKPTLGSKVNLEHVESTIARAHEHFRIRELLADPWQGEYLASRLRGEGVPIDLFAFTEPHLDELARHTINLFSERRVRLFADEILEADLRQMSVIERTSGKLRLSFPENEYGHGDVGTAFVLALLAASRATYIPQATLDFRPFAIGRGPAWRHQA